jgi:hypothetical protein
MSRVGFEPTIPAFERAKTVDALDRAAAVIGWFYFNQMIITLWRASRGMEHMYTSSYVFCLCTFVFRTHDSLRGRLPITKGSRIYAF